METRNLRYMPGHLSLNLLIDMDNKITALSDDELMEVSGGWLIFASNDTCSSNKTKDSCSKKANCSWNSSTSKCERGGL